MVITAKKKSKTGLQILPKIIHIYPKNGEKRRPLYRSSHQKKSSCIYSVFEYSLRTLGEALLEKIY
jgi:hypothetical protein